MGLIKNLKPDSEVSFIHYNVGENEITLHLLDLNEKYLYTKINTESECIKRWAKNLQQTPENYLAQLLAALEEQTEDESAPGPDTTPTMDTPRLEEPSGTKISTQQNSFELDGENNLIWKQCFESKKIFGRKGKFSLAERPRRQGIDILMSSLVTELSDKEKRIRHYDQECNRLLKEKGELRKIAEESVTMKGKFETEIFGKFCSLLNAKKKKNCELRDQILQKSDSVPVSPPRPSASTVRESRARSRSPSSDDEFEADTDVDSPDEVQNETSNRLKRRSQLKGGESAVAMKRSKSGKHQESLPEFATSRMENNMSPDSPGILDASLESDLKFGFGSHTSKEKH